MNFELNDEKATLILMWWMGSTDGCVDYKEDREVNYMLGKLPFDPYAYYSETKMYLSGVSSGKMNKLIAQSIRWGYQRFSEEDKRNVIKMLYRIVESQHTINKKERGKLMQIEKGFDISTTASPVKQEKM